MEVLLRNAETRMPISRSPHKMADDSGDGTPSRRRSSDAANNNFNRGLTICQSRRAAQKRRSRLFGCGGDLYHKKPWAMRLSDTW